MINLSPIAKKVQKRLFQKMAALNKDVKYPDSDPNVLSESDMLTRTTYIKMVSNQKPSIVIMGGELIPKGEDEMTLEGDLVDLYRPADNFDDIYGPRIVKRTLAEDTLGDEYAMDDDEPIPGSTKVVNPNKKSRPYPGIKSIDVSFKGGMRAHREATVNWTCWSFEDLDRLRSHFLAHGNTVLLEWGWMFNENDLMNRPTFHTMAGIHADAYNADYLPYILDEGGDMDMMVGVIKNFEYTTRDDGGFDCQTIIGSIGVNMVDSFIPDDNTLKPQEIINADTKGERKRLIAKLKRGGKEKILAFNLEATLKSFIEKLDMYVANECAKNKVWESRKVLGLAAGVQSGMAIHVSPNKFIAISNNNQTALGENGIIRQGWVRWGWFEDNVLSKFTSLTTKNDEVITSLRSIDINLKTGARTSVRIKNSKYLETMDTTYYILPGQFNPRQKDTNINVGGEIITLQGDTYSVRQLANMVNTNFPRFDGVEAVDTKPEKYEGDGPQNAKLLKALGAPEGTTSITDYLKSKNRKSDIESRRTLWNETFGGTVTPNPNVGLLRNMLVNINKIQEAFANASSLNDGLHNLFAYLNTPINFWTFDFLQDPIDVNRCKIIDDQNTGVDFTKPISKQRSLYNLETGNFINKEAFPSEEGIFYFPVWQSNSIVKRQNITAKVPNAMQLATMYGANVDQLKNITGPSGFAEKAGTLVGGLTNTERDFDKKLEGLDFAFKNFANGGGNIGTKNGLAGEELSADGGKEDAVWTFIKDKVASHMFKDLNETQDEQDNETKARVDLEYLEVEHDPNKPIPVISFLESSDMQKVFAEVDSAHIDEIKETYGSKYVSGLDGFIGNTYNVIIKSNVKKSILYLARNHTSAGESEDDNSYVIPLEMELDIDGTGGIYPGNSYHSTYLPKRYQDKTVFQMFDVNHRVDSGGWTTAISGKMRTTVNQIFDIISKDDVLQNLVQNYKNMLADESNYQRTLAAKLAAEAAEKARLAKEQEEIDKQNIANLTNNRTGTVQKENKIIDAVEDTKKGVVTPEKAGDQTILRKGTTPSTTVTVQS